MVLPEREADVNWMIEGGLRDKSETVVYGSRELLLKFFDQCIRKQVPEEVNPPDREAAKLHALGVVLGSKGQRSLALENLDRAVQIWKRVAQTGREDLRAELAASLHARARILGAAERYDEALRDYAEAVRIRSQLIEYEQRGDLRTALADSLSGRALVLVLKHKWAEAASDYDAAIALRSRAENLDAAGTASLAEDYRTRALVRGSADDRAGAIGDLARAVELYSNLVDSEGESEFGDRLAQVLASRAGHLDGTGRLAEALQDHDRAVELCRRRMQREHLGSDADLAANLGNRAKTHLRNSDAENALHDLEEAVGQYRDLVERRGRDDLARNLADACFEYAVFAAVDSQHAKAKPLFDEAVELYTRLVAGQGQEDLRRRLAQAHHVRAEGLPRREALDDLAAAITIYQDLFQHDADPALALELAGCIMHRANRRSSDGWFAEAIEDYERAVALETPLLVDMREKVSNYLFYSLNGLAWIRATCSDASLRDGQLALDHATRACELTEWSNYQAFDTLAASYAERGDFDRAVEWQLKATQQASEEERAGFQSRLELYRAGRPYHEAHIDREPPSL
jgi:tetratricopeptide (TPR) repeat protein